MKYNKGFAPMVLLLIVLGVAVVGGVIYYTGKSPKILPQTEENNSLQENQNVVNKPVQDNQIKNTTDNISYIKVDKNNSVVLANNSFAFDVFSKLIKKGENTFFSPFSISSAFGMVYEGANGKTADEIQSVFHFPKDINILRTSFSSINNEINKPNSDYQLTIANALWAQKDYKFLDEYFSNVDKYYSGKATNLDFKNATEDARLTINKWIEDKTNSKIKDILPPKSLDTMTKLVLTNAIYFNGKWDKTFDKKETKADTTFLSDSGNDIKVNMMQQSNDDKTIFNYTENENSQMLEMPYKGDKLSMIIVLPKENNITSFEKLFTLSNFDNWKKNLKKQRVNVYIPQFKFGIKYLMADTLKLMGMPTAFSGNADFSKMDGTKDLFISSVIHQAFVDVNEDGTEAAAATVISMNAGSYFHEGPVIPTFYANHPFLFVIQDTTNGNILFIGKIVNPSLK
ncbi:MAG: serpin family protein [Candidatus Paceibacterota bacterium]